MKALGLVTLLIVPGFANPVTTGKLTAPALEQCQTTKKYDLGIWDDAIRCPDGLVLLRGDELFILNPTRDATPRRTVKDPLLEGARIVDQARTENKLWLSFQSSHAAPFAIEVFTGQVAKFEIPGLRIPGAQAPEIQAIVTSPKTEAAILEISGGDSSSWPRDGNRPLYFWLGLKSGEVSALPIGWDLEFFSPTLETAVFATAKPFKSGHRVLAAMDFRSGEMKPNPPDRRPIEAVPFNRTDHPGIKPLYSRRPETGDIDYFSGVVIDGQPHSFDHDLGGEFYMSTTKFAPGFVGIGLRRSGQPSKPFDLWLEDLRPEARPFKLADKVTDFAILKSGSSVVITSGGGRRGLSSEAQFFSADGRSLWNLLDGIERLPALPPDLAKKSSVVDDLNIRLIESSVGGPILLIFTQYRRDEQSTPMDIIPRFKLPLSRESFQPEKWQRALVIDNHGGRFVTDLFRDGTLPDEIWLERSNKVIAGNYFWERIGGKEKRQLKLTGFQLQLEK